MSSPPRTSDGAVRKPKKSVACRRCHTQKIKCSGGHPCAKCRQFGTPDECIYVNRDRRVQIHESHLERITAENKRLRDELARSQAASSQAEAMTDNAPPLQEPDQNTRNPMLDEDAWFQPYDPSKPPIHIGDAACTAFATRLRQVLTRNSKTSHMPRDQYITEESLMGIGKPTIQWPTLTQARLYCQIVFHQVNRTYHLALHKSTVEELEEVYQKGTFDDPNLTCKFFALFALGEVYSGRMNANFQGVVPGTAYYVNAMTLIPILPERPSLTHIESILLLSLYSYFLNRRHSAFLLVGTAMRLGLVLGLNHDIPECKCPDPVIRQHRIRLWWTIYVFDRMYGSKVGWPIQIADDDIHVQMPSDVAEHAQKHQFSDTRLFTANIELAKIIGQVTEKIYSRKPKVDSFLQREQKLLSALKHWAQVLPAHIRLNRETSSPKHLVSLHLQFNQCIVLATRPVLLHSLIQSRMPKNMSDKDMSSNGHNFKTLNDACIQAARNIHSMILEEWINGTLPTFGYFYVHYLFSSALIMLISSEIHESSNDFMAFETAIEILHTMSGHGNLAAKEFYDNLECLQHCLYVSKEPAPLTEVLGRVDQSSAQGPRGPLPMNSIPESEYKDVTQDDNAALVQATNAASFVDETALQGQSMDNFLRQTDVEFDTLLPAEILDEGSGLANSWPEFSLWTI